MKKDIFLICILFMTITISKLSMAQVLKQKTPVLINRGSVTTTPPNDTTDNKKIGKVSNQYGSQKTNNGTLPSVVSVNQKPNQLPVRGSTGGNNPKYDQINANLSPSISGIYSQSLRTIDGRPVDVSYRLGKNIYAATQVNASNSVPQRMVRQFSKNYQTSHDGINNCSQENINVKITDDSYMKVPVESQAANIYPGAIYQFNNYINGSWKAETTNRNPIVISASVENMSGSPNEAIQSPDLNSIRQAKVNLFGRFSRKPEEVANGAFKVKVEEIWSSSDLDIKVGATGYGGGFSASNNFSYQKKVNSRCFLFDCTKEMFTLDVEQPSNGFFSQVPSVQSPMMYISSVTYGLRIIAMVQFEISNEEIANNFNGSYTALTAGGSVAVDIASKIDKGKATVSMFVVGGQSNTVYQEYSIDAMKTRLQQITGTLNYNTSKPILYVFRNMEDEVVRYSSATDWFPMRNCEPASEAEKPASFTVSVDYVRLDNYQQDDVDLYGIIRAEIVDGNGNTIQSNENLPLADIGGGQYISSETIKSDKATNWFRKLTFNVGAGNVPGSKLKIIYWLKDHDSGPDDQFTMAGRRQPDFINNGVDKYYIKVIDLDAAKLGTSLQDNSTFVDEDSENPVTITIGVVKMRQ